jgi:hypothetical protein
MNEQAENISRVNSQIGKYVAAFLGARINKEFHGGELYMEVASKVDQYIAPDSPGRIMRDLKQRGVVDYELLDRRKSLYKSLPVQPQGSLF